MVLLLLHLILKYFIFAVANAGKITSLEEKRKSGQPRKRIIRQNKINFLNHSNKRLN
jgi:hypothetical protein